MIDESNINMRVDYKLDIIHQQVIQELNLHARAARDSRKARRMTEVLTKVKNFKKVPVNQIDARLTEQAINLAQQTLATLNIDRKATQGTSAFSNLFTHAYKSVKTASGGDDIFEEELAAFMAALENEVTVTKVPITVGDRLVGNQSANVKLERDISQKVVKAMQASVNKWAKDEATKLDKDGQKVYAGPVARSGKADVMGGSATAVIKADVNPILRDMFKLFQGHSFSVKNYSGYSQHDIALGKTDYFKAIYGALSHLGYSQDYIEKVFYSGMNLEDNAKVQQHFYHLRFMYELMGPGLYDKDGNKIDAVDFLIWNDPNSDRIFVESTAEMLLRQLEINRKKGLVGITTSKRDFIQHAYNNLFGAS